MKETKKDFTKKWEVSILRLTNNGERFKVTRKHPDLAISETRIYSSKEDAKHQFDEWLK
ncbi:hypothetical protein HOK51_06710 [Candidatus Woesearchaeota archaeon]|jgi:hypothetical protein|nr:hypothetical protein [Candidatus Woesearchaeota archaeon]MBT6519514.1 hypothetical protein [Candidatus Woesearchaeota archaeon]MBT7367409.1 hypothetical protein [Candidatus Woesearchaeota archaeon]